MKGEMKNLLEVCSSVMASLCYCYFVCSRIPKGKYRLISLLPVLSLFSLLPLHLTFVIPTVLAGIYVVWIANFRLLFFAFDMGPLSSPEPQDPKPSLPKFILLAFFPVRYRRDRNRSYPKTLSKLILNLPTEILLVSLGTAFAHLYMDILDLNPIMKTVLYCCMAFLTVDVCFAFVNAAAVAVGFEVDPTSDEPFFATSVQDFWGKRWNLMITNHLRFTVCEPVRAAFGPVMGREWAGAIGIFAAFLVSGLMHELLVYYPSRGKPTWEMTGYFVLQGLCVILEIRVKKALAGRLRLHWAVSIPLTIGFVAVTAFFLFIPPVTRVGLDRRNFSEPFLFFNYLKKCLSNIMILTKRVIQLIKSDWLV